MKNRIYTIFHIVPMQETREFSEAFAGMVRIYQLFKRKVQKRTNFQHYLEPLLET